MYADAGKFSRCVTLWTYALDMQQTMLEPLNPMTQSSLFSFTELFSFMMGEEGRFLVYLLRFGLNVCFHFKTLACCDE